MELQSYNKCDYFIQGISIIVLIIELKEGQNGDHENVEFVDFERLWLCKADIGMKMKMKRKQGKEKGRKSLQVSVSFR